MAALGGKSAMEGNPSSGPAGAAAGVADGGGAEGGDEGGAERPQPAADEAPAGEEATGDVGDVDIVAGKPTQN